MDLQLKGKKALVMASSQGLGRAIAESLIAEGVEVIISSRDKEKLQRVSKEIGAKSYIEADLSKPGAAKALTEKAIAALGGLDILVTNTGGPKRANFDEVTDEQWHNDFQSLWMSVVESLQVCLPVMKKQKYGRVLMVTSFAAKEPKSGLTTSNGLRAGLIGLAKSVSNEVAAEGITINQLLPGYTATDRLKERGMDIEKFKSLIPAQRLGEPRELADLATFLASPRAGYVTGQAIAVDGGANKGH
jgi:3-oxoacyl-[acyl-carrier protein] reductase